MAPSNPMSSGGAPPRRSAGGSALTNYFMVILFGFGVLTLWMNLHHEAGIADQHTNIRDFKEKHFKHRSRKTSQKNLEAAASVKKPGDALDAPKNAKEAKTEKQAVATEKVQPPPKVDRIKKIAVKDIPQQVAKEEMPQEKEDEDEEAELPKEAMQSGHVLAGLDCEPFGGPDPQAAKEMVYWQDIPSDAHHISPFHRPDRKQYMTFEPDQGGWNNIRMSMESVLALAAATGRTLVLPPEQGMYLLENHEGGKQRKHFSFNDFFHMESIAREHKGLDVIHMDEFLEKMAMTGKLLDQKTGRPSFPPGNRTNWNGSSRQEAKVLSKYLRTVTLWPWWDPEKCLAAFPANPKHLEKLRHMKEEIEKQGGFKPWQNYVGKPLPVDAPPEARLKENWADRKDLCLYNETLQDAPVVHFGYDYGGGGARLLVHFYAFLFFEDWRQDLWMKRFVRDHVRYVDEIQCAAARVVKAVRERATKRGTGPEFDTFHIRRGDFQFTVTRFEAEKIHEVSKDELTPNATVYISTDERNKTFFQPLADHYDVVFLDDYVHLLQDVNTNFYGMIDQLVATRGRVFFGCWFSTFTGYINRIRGYNTDREKKPGYEDGIVPKSFYYALEDRKYHMQEFYPVKKSFYAREFPTSWRGIDKSIGELTTTAAIK